MKKLLFLFILFASLGSHAQKIDSIYVNLYTDSLKKGTYNYINVDGLTNAGKYLPLDSTKVSFSCSDAKFFGNTLFIPADFKDDKVKIKVALRSDEKKSKEFEMFIKKTEDPPLKSEAEVLDGLKRKKKSKTEKT